MHLNPNRNDNILWIEWAKSIRDFFNAIIEDNIGYMNGVHIRKPISWESQPGHVSRTAKEARRINTTPNGSYKSETTLISHITIIPDQ